MLKNSKHSTIWCIKSPTMMLYLSIRATVTGYTSSDDPEDFNQALAHKKHILEIIRSNHTEAQKEEALMDMSDA